MISELRGKLVHKSPTEIVIDVNGVGYEVHIPLSTYERINWMNNELSIFTYLHIRENAMILYGFSTEAEREIFRLLLSVSGIGPRTSLGILSGIDTDDLRTAIRSGNIEVLKSISGVGKKTAERIVLELRGKLGNMEITELAVTSTTHQMKVRSEAIVALMSLGYTRSNAEYAITAVLSDPTIKDQSVEELIKKALHRSAKI